MEWAEIKRRLKNGTSVQVLADLEAIPYKTMYNRIMAHQVKDGVTYLTPENTKGMKKAKAISDTKQKQAKEKEKAAGLPEDPGKLPEVPEDKPLIIPFPDPEKVGLCPEVMEMLRENCEACRKLAESYARQASEYAHLLKRYGVDIPEAQKKKAEDLRRIFSEVQ